MKVLVKRVAIKAHTYIEEGEHLKGSLEKALMSIKVLEKEASSFKDEVVAVLD